MVMSPPLAPVPPWHSRASITTTHQGRPNHFYPLYLCSLTCRWPPGQHTAPPDAGRPTHASAPPLSRSQRLSAGRARCPRVACRCVRRLGDHHYSALALLGEGIHQLQALQAAPQRRYRAASRRNLLLQ